MTALVVARDPLERASLTACLDDAHAVRTAESSAMALALLTEKLPRVIVMAWDGEEDGELVRCIRARAETRDAHVIALVSSPESSAVAEMYEAGVDDFIRRPVMKEELVARLSTLGRSGVWQRSMPPGPRSMPVGRMDPRKLQAFQNMGGLVGGDLSQLVGELEVSEGWMVAGDLRGACIPMSIARERSEIRVSVVVETKLVRALAESLLGDPDAPDDALEDMLREIANTAGGAVKRAAADESVELTTGLPVNEGRGVARNEMTRCWTARHTDTGMLLGIIGEVLTRATMRVRIAEAHEGMVLSLEVRDSSGEIVLPAGTRLTRTSAERIASAMGPAHEIEVMSEGS